ncbi:MAG: 5'-nucleotidase, lipoprotein e(P4) family [Acidobacteriota bacterium]
MRLRRLHGADAVRACSLLLATPFIVSACTSGAQQGASDGEIGAENLPAHSIAAAPIGIEQLNAVLWTQTSVEYRAVALQSYERARSMLDTALADPTWTATLEQTGPFDQLPPALIVDVDETVLDNSPYQARLILDRQRFSAKSWGRWVGEAAAAAVPGALEFCTEAASKGVTIFYVSNRTADLEEGTRANLERLGFPLQEGVDVVLLRGEKPEWQTSDKGPRRQTVASDYRVLLLIGDNMGDFTSAASGTIAERSAVADEQFDYWGRRWIVLPNPQYGSWERALLGADTPESDAERLQRKLQALDPKR